MTGPGISSEPVRDIVVECDARRLTLGDWSTACVIGRGGPCAAPAKREGDGCTPIGRWPLRGLLARPDRVPALPPVALPWRWLRPGDGWSDGPTDPSYNRPVRLPHLFSAETMWRADAAYDLVLVLGHNDMPPVPGAGSAIFFHLWVERTDGMPGATEGCVAVSRSAMMNLLPHLRPDMAMRII